LVLRAVLGLVLLAGSADALGQTAPHKHSITVTFNYDFRLTPACTAGARKNCVQEFIVYDLSAGPTNRRRLASKPADSSATGNVKGISIASPKLLFDPGKHLIAVVARTPDGIESDLYKCTIWLHFE